jgi:opacity protein-like surface antigen
MKKSILTIAGSALIALSAVQFAAASEHQRGRVHHRASVRDSNAYVTPAFDAVQPERYRYSGGYSAPAGR